MDAVIVYIIVFVIAFSLGYLFAVWGSWVNLQKGKMFYLRENGSWYPYNPASHTDDIQAVRRRPSGIRPGDKR